MANLYVNDLGYECFIEEDISLRAWRAVEDREHSEEKEPIAQAWVSYETTLNHVKGLLNNLEVQDEKIIGK